VIEQAIQQSLPRKTTDITVEGHKNAHILSGNSAWEVNVGALSWLSLPA
jgi:hypothetical protein